MLILFIFIIVSVMLLAFFGSGWVLAATGWWHYRKVCIPVSAVLLIFFGWIMVLNLAAGIFFNLILQWLVGMSARVFYNQKLRKKANTPFHAQP